MRDVSAKFIKFVVSSGKPVVIRSFDTVGPCALRFRIAEYEVIFKSVAYGGFSKIVAFFFEQIYVVGKSAVTRIVGDTVIMRRSVFLYTVVIFLLGAEFGFDSSAARVAVGG